MAYSIDKLIRVAEAEIGYLEKETNKNLDDKTANAGDENYTKYGKYFGMVKAQWCDLYVDWCFCKAFGDENAEKLLGKFSAFTPYSAQYLKNMGRWYTKNPKRGDIIFYKNSERICHTGIVYAVDDTYVYTIEGNTSGASGVVANGGGVCRKKYALNYKWIAGYGRPDYGDQWVEEKYNTWGKITAISLNVREEPSTDADVVNSYNEGDCVFVATKTDTGWYKTNKGYVSAKYVEVDYMTNDTRDNTPNAWAVEDIEYCLTNDIVKGDADGNLRLRDNITREEAFVIASRICKFLKGE